MDGVKLKILEKLDEMPDSSYGVWKNFFNNYSQQHINRLCKELKLQELIRIQKKEKKNGVFPVIILEITKKGIQLLEKLDSSMRE